MAWLNRGMAPVSVTEVDKRTVLSHGGWVIP